MFVLLIAGHTEVLGYIGPPVMFCIAYCRSHRGIKIYWTAGNVLYCLLQVTQKKYLSLPYNMTARYVFML